MAVGLGVLISSLSLAFLSASDFLSVALASRLRVFATVLVGFFDDLASEALRLVERVTLAADLEGYFEDLDTEADLLSFAVVMVLLPRIRDCPVDLLDVFVLGF